MLQGPLISYAQNREDVVLWRALKDVLAGRYIEVGANHPRVHSVSRTFYDRGWSGLTIEPVPAFAELHRKERPRDRQVEAAVTSAPVDEITLHLIPETGLSTLVDDVSDRHETVGFAHEDVIVKARRLDAILEETGWSHDDIHFLLIDVEGAEQDVLASIDLTVWRPWVLVIESTEPLSTTQSHDKWERAVLDAGYEFCLFDGISRFYAATERIEALKPKLSYPACALDDYSPYTLVEMHANADAELEAERTHRSDEVARLKEQVSELNRQLVRWRHQGLENWADAVSGAANGSSQEAEAMRSTLSWRITEPLRAVRRLSLRSNAR